MKIKFGWKFWFTVIFGLVAYGFLFYELITRARLGEITHSVSQLHWYYLLFGLFLGFVMITVQGFFLKKIFALYQVDIGLKESTLTWLYTVPTGAVTAGLSGMAIIFYKARSKKVSFEFATLITATYFIFYTVSALLFVFLISGSAYYQDLIHGHSFRIVDILFAILAVLLIIFLFHQPSRIKVVNFLSRVLPKFFPEGEKEKIIRLSNDEVFKIILYGFLICLSNLAIFALSLVALRIAMSPFDLFKNFAFFQLISMFSPSGGGLGFVELGLAGSLRLTGVSLAAASAAIVSFRAINFWLPAILGWLAISFKGVDYIKGKVSEPDS